MYRIDGREGEAVPSFVKFDPANLILKVNATEEAHAKLYKFDYTSILVDYPDVSAKRSFELLVHYREVVTKDGTSTFEGVEAFNAT